MAYQEDIALMAHLMRRAGFGAGRDEIEARAAKGYEATVPGPLDNRITRPRGPVLQLALGFGGSVAAAVFAVPEV